MKYKLRLADMGGWRTEYAGYGSTAAHAIANAQGEVIAIAVRKSMNFRPPNVTPIARRIVACCNACTGITTEQLESDFAQGYEPWGDVQHLRAQRDELISALSEMVERFAPNAWGSAENRRDALNEAQAVLDKHVTTSEATK